MDMSKSDSRIKTFDHHELGTSLARKRGIQEAKGNFIVFSNQDDAYINDNSLCNMLEAIIADNVDIVQFNHYNSFLGLKRRKRNDVEERIFNKNEIRNVVIGGIFGAKNSPFNTPVWNKIYRGECLKNILKEITVSLYYAEDQFLNILAFTYANRVSVRNNAYYCWELGGFSSSENASLAFFEDYEIIRPIQFEYISKYYKDSNIKYNLCMEAIYLVKFVMVKMIKNKEADYDIILMINRLNSYRFVQVAKEYFNKNLSYVYEELNYLINYKTEDDYYNYIKNNLPKDSIKIKIISLLNKITKIIK